MSTMILLECVVGTDSNRLEEEVSDEVKVRRGGKCRVSVILHWHIYS